MAGFTEKSMLADKLLALAGTIDAVKDEDYSEDATELLDADDARHLREAAAILETAGVTPSLRDYFAAKALPLAWQMFTNVEEVDFAHVAREAYEMADAMLAERLKGGAQ